MSKIANDALTRLAQDALQLYPYGYGGCQRVKVLSFSTDSNSSRFYTDLE